MALDLDRYVLQPCMAVWGSPVTFHGPTDPPLIVRAVFDDRYREAKFDDLVGEVVSQRPMLGLRAASFPPGRGPAQGDLFAINGRFYVVSNPPEADGHGHLKVPLRFATDDEARRAALSA